MAGQSTEESEDVPASLEYAQLWQISAFYRVLLFKVMTDHTLTKLSFDTKSRIRNIKCMALLHTTKKDLPVK